MADMSLTRNRVDEAVDEGIVDGVKAQLFECCKPSKRFGSDHKIIKITSVRVRQPERAKCLSREKVSWVDDNKQSDRKAD